MKSIIRTGSLFIAALALLATPVARSEDAKKPEGAMAAPKPAPELAQLKPFLGSWNCSGKAFASPMGPEHSSKGSLSTRMDLGGFWYAIHYDEMKTKENPSPFRVAAFWGYDSAQKKFVAVSVDGMGGYGTSTSAGWEGDKMVFTGDYAGMGPNKMPGRDTFTKKGDNEISHMGEISMAEGQWMKTDEETCHRASGAKSPAKSEAAKTDAKPEAKK